MMIDYILNALEGAIEWLVNIVVDIINGVIDIYRDVRDWFRNLPLKKHRDIAWIAKANVLEKMLKTAPKIEGTGIFQDDNAIIEGVYNQEDEAISHIRCISSSDGVDNKIKNILKDAPVVILE